MKGKVVSPFIMRLSSFYNGWVRHRRRVRGS